MGKFAAQGRAFLEGTRRQIDQDVRAIQLALFTSVILDTPVDTGRLRGNWQTSVGKPSKAVLDRTDKNGEQAKAEILANMGGAGNITFLSNNLPYAETVEYGLFPNPPKRGTYVPAVRGRKRKDGSRKLIAAGHYEIRSAGGFSKRAPAGMLRINAARIAEIVREVIGARGGKKMIGGRRGSER